MRGYILLLAALAVLAGCVEDSEPEPAPENPQTNETVTPPMAKVNGPQQSADQSFQVTGGWEAAVDIQNAGGQDICSLATSDCDRWDFTVAASGDVVATLSWTTAANDLDLYLFDAAGNEISRDGINQIGEPPGTSQVLQHTGLTPGDYQFVVVPWSAVNETYTLDVDLS
ncbi:MAG: hypothetical protein ACPHID_03705 [Thermoplasmatota archaeon]